MTVATWALFFLYGLYGLLAQVFILRELGLVFLGHELSFNLALASWLLWTGIGASPKAGRDDGDAKRAAGRALALFCLAAPLTLLAIRAAKLLTPFGSLPGVAEAFLVPLLLLLVVCQLNGSVFRLGTRLMPAQALYFLECAGALAGGLLASFVLVGRVPGLLALSAGAALLAAAAWIVLRGVWPGACALAAAALVCFAAPVDQASRRAQWRGYRLLEQREGRYGHLAMARAGSLKVAFENGIVSSHFPDPAASEELVHWPLLAHPRPRRVLLLGAGAAPLVAEVLKHPVKSVDVVTADPEALDFARAYLEGAPARAWKDPRVQVRLADPRDWARAHPAAYDVVLQLAPDPANASLNRFFTAEFFAEAKTALADRGLLAFSVPSSENYLAPESAYLDASIWNALKESFPNVAAVPGGRMVLVAGARPFQLEPAALARTYEARKIANRTLVPVQFPFYLMPERRAALAARLGELGGVPPNRDLKPAAYLLTWRLWLSKFVSPLHFLGLCVLAGAAFWGVLGLWRKRAELAGSRGKLAMLSLGFSGMGLEVVLLIGFQVACGALYWKLGLLLAAFMAGLAVGAAAAGGRRARPRLGLGALLVCLAGLEVAVALRLPALIGAGASRALLPFAALLALDGLLVGAAYPLACSEDPAGVYAADLWGSSLGAFLAAAFLVPLAGMEQALLVCAAALAPALIRLLI